MYIVHAYHLLDMWYDKWQGFTRVLRELIIDQDQ